MCYHASKTYTIDDLENYYNDLTSNHAFDVWQRFYHENGYDHNFSPVAVGKNLENFSWGLIPWHTKSLQDALMIRNQTLNCISEEMWDKSSFRDSIKEGKRCLIPMTGFFEWEWLDAKGKNKQPHHVFMKNQKIFSVAGIHSSWRNRDTDQVVYTYAVLTTKANKLMERIHNNKKRMPVIIPREYEKDWLNPLLTREDVEALCQPIDDSLMDAHTISKLITSRSEPTNVPKVLEKATIELQEPSKKKTPPPKAPSLFD
jgi:putative SOS response-associated peptidase YedK